MPRIGKLFVVALMVFAAIATHPLFACDVNAGKCVVGKNMTCCIDCDGNAFCSGGAESQLTPNQKKERALLRQQLLRDVREEAGQKHQ